MLTERHSSRPRWLAALDALATPHGLDGYLEWIRPSWTLGRARATLARVDRQTAGSITLQLRPSHSWQGFCAGQHVELGLDIDGRRYTRCYSPASSAHDPTTIELTIAVHPDGIVSRWLEQHARPGQVFELSPARGDFVLPDPRPERVLLISGGSGITPLLCMLRTLCDEGFTRPICMLHYASSRNAMPYREELDRIVAGHAAVSLARGFSREPGEGELVGRFGREQLRAVEPEYASAETFVCGPEGLIDAVTELFETEGLTGRLHTESFRPLRYTLRGDAAQGRITFERSGVEVASDGRTLLEQAESAGLSPAHGCRRGICHTCACRIEAGVVRNVQTGVTRTVSDADVQLCVHAPAGDVHIDL